MIISKCYKAKKAVLMHDFKHKYLFKRMDKKDLPQEKEYVMFKCGKLFMTCQCLDVDTKINRAMFVKLDYGIEE